AEQAGYADQVQLLLAKARAHIASSHYNDAASIVDGLLSRKDLSYRRSEAMLLRADVMMGRQEPVSAIRSFVASIPRDTLKESDDAYASAILATTTDE